MTNRRSIGEWDGSDVSHGLYQQVRSGLYVPPIPAPSIIPISGTTYHTSGFNNIYPLVWSNAHKLPILGPFSLEFHVTVALRVQGVIPPEADIGACVIFSFVRQLFDR